ERTARQKDLKVVIAQKLASVPDVRAWYVNERGEREMAFSILSKDGAALDEAVARIETKMRKVDGYLNVATSGSLSRPELTVRPKLEQAASLGVTPEAISEAVRVATIGDVGANLAKFNAGDRLVPIRVQLDEAARADIRNIAALRVTNSSGVSIPLTAVAEIGFGEGPSSIDRYDRVRRAAIGADLKRGFELGTAQETFHQIVKEVGLPDGVWIAATGDAEIQGEVVAGFIQAMTTGLMLVLAVLILLFGSVFQPITILLSLPLSFGGVVIALLATGKPVSMPVYIGLLMLMGIVTKNAIMLVDFAVEEEARGKDRRTALLEAGRKRARPIVMTTIAMAAGMLPSAYGVGDGGEFRAPMAIAVIGGLLVSTVLSLVFVPSFYAVMDDLSKLTGRVFGRFLSKPEDESLWEAMP
ncbi:MAG: ABC transporter permease, partial [Methylobacterium sp.]|nr:ABC transporter permease [Methylobacterium sp.]